MEGVRRKWKERGKRKEREGKERKWNEKEGNGRKENEREGQ